jgi:C-terminal processing protease CtpA/Prc
VHAIDGTAVTRESYWGMVYALYGLRPRATTTLTLENADGVHDVLVETEVVPERRVQNLSGSDEGTGIWDLIIEMENLERDTRERYHVIDDSVFVWQMTGFARDHRPIDDMMNRVRAFPGLVLDLRGNHGGAARGLQRLVSYFVDSTVVLDTLRTRKRREPEIVEPRRNPCRGRLVVLVDSESASAAEMFARTIQLQRRGSVIGDRTPGMVTHSRFQRRATGAGTVVYYGTSVTIADVVMSDGGRLEGVGVVPDEVLLPTAADLREGRDPALAHAIGLLGGSVSAEEAGGLFPRRRWR